MKARNTDTVQQFAAMKQIALAILEAKSVQSRQ